MDFRIELAPSAWRWPVKNLGGNVWRYSKNKTQESSEPLYSQAELTAALKDERERCAKVCEAMISRAPTSTSYADYLVVTALADAAELIRGQAESGQR